MSEATSTCCDVPYQHAHHVDGRVIETYTPHRRARGPAPDDDGWLYGVAWVDPDDRALRVSGPRHYDDAVEAVAVLRGPLGSPDTAPDTSAAWLVRAQPLAWERVPEAVEGTDR